ISNISIIKAFTAIWVFIKNFLNLAKDYTKLSKRH
ncbi:unnamed protein product, partial [marine sediment metagenome]